MIRDSVVGHYADLGKLYLESVYLSAVTLLTQPLLLRLVTARADGVASTIPMNVRFMAQTW